MNRDPGKLSRSVATAAFLAVALLHILPRTAGAEEPPADAAEAEAVVDDATAEASEAVPVDATAQDTVEALVVAPGGVPAEAADAKSAIDVVKAAMAQVEQTIDGVGDNYVINFGDTFDGCRWSRGSGSRGHQTHAR